VAPDQESDSDDPLAQLLRSNTKVFSSHSKQLLPSTLDFKKLKNANSGHNHQSCLTSLSWHPREDMLLTCGLDRKCKLIAMPDAHGVQELFLEDLPVQRSAFVCGGKQALLVGQRKHYYCYDLGAQKLQKLSGIQGLEGRNIETLEASREKYYAVWGRAGDIGILGQDSKKLLFSLKMNGQC
jgi:WD40 repeat protein